MQFTLSQVHAAIFDGLKSRCNCSLHDSNVVSDSLSCSEVVDNSALYRASLHTNGGYTALFLHDILYDWLKDNPSIVLNNTQYEIDTTCPILAESADQSECDEAVEDDRMNTLLIIIIGIIASLVICILLIVIPLCICSRNRQSTYSLSQSFK